MKSIKYNYLLSIITAIALWCSPNMADASHIMGGDLTFTCLGGSNYSFQLRLFRDCNGIGLGNTQTITFTSPTCGTQQVTLNLVAGYPQVITPLCPGEPDVCVNGFGTYGVQEYVYKGTVTLSGCFATATDITVSWSSCCRNGAITTLTTPGATYISTDLNAGLSPCNNSPDFLNSPIAFFCVNEPVNYSHGASDPDNDSLVFSLVPCQASAGNPNSYANPYSGTNPLASSTPITIDPATGGLQFTPSLVQVGIVCILVEEYRNGVKIGEVVRDMQFTIISCSNTLPVASGIDGTASATGTTGDFTMSVCAGDTVQFDVTTFDPDVAGITPQTLVLDWNQAVGGASFTSDGAALPTGSFFWVPTNADVGNNIFTVDISDDGCPINGINIYSFLIRVKRVPELDAGPYQVTCAPGDSVTLNATYNASGISADVTWFPLDFVSDTSLTMTTAGPDSTITYRAEARYSNGCYYEDSVIIEVSDGVTLPALSDTTICQGSVQLDASINSSTAGGSRFANNNSVAVPDNDPNGASTSITVSGVSPAAISAGTIDSVCINLSHLTVADFDVFLVAPDGTLLELTTDNGGFGQSYTNTCFTPTAATSITAGAAPFTGAFLPEGNFNTLNGISTNGTWQLLVIDDGLGFTGTINSWSISFADPNQVTYTWTPSATLSCSNCPDPLATPLSTTTYTVSASNQNGCLDTATVTIFVEDTLQAPTINCAGIAPSSLTFCWDTLAGATGYEINVDNAGWITPNGPGTNCHTVTGLAIAQTVSVQVRGVTNCSNTVALIGTQSCTTSPCILDASLVSTTNVSCAGGNSGTANITSVGGNMPVQYSIDGGTTLQPTGAFTGLSSGNYVVTVIDATLCSDTVQFTITEPSPMITTMSFDSVSCAGGNDGTASVAVTGGAGLYTYQWSGGISSTTANANNLTAGTYIVTITDVNNCTIQDTIIVGEPDTLTLASVSVDVSCNGAADGSVILTTTGGNGGNSFSWTGTATTSDSALGLSGGIYSATVTDSKGCTAAITDTINENSAIVLDTASAASSCFGVSDGQAIVIATGGTGTYTYMWAANAANQTTDTAFNVTAGSYEVIVTDTDGCADTITAVVTAPASMTSSMVSTSANCHNTTDGTATITVSGGSGGYTYAWNNSPSTTATANMLGTGFQAVTVTDVNGCQIVDSVQVTGPTPISIALTPVNVSCFGDGDGAVTSNVSGGSGGYTYAWSNTATSTDLNNLSGGTYIVTVTDANGCFDTASAFVFEPTELILTLDSVDVTCFNGSNGQANVTAAGGTFPYVYQWSPSGQVTPNASGLTTGYQTILVTDANGCSATDSILVNQPAAPITTTMAFTPLVCNGDSSGTATVTAMGGTVGAMSDYTYQWDANAGSQTTATATNLAAGTYIVVVYDDNFCSMMDTVIVTEPTPVTTTSSTTPANCYGAADGTAVTTPVGGVGNYSYSWNTIPVQTDSLATSLVAGAYVITVQDSNACTITDTVTVIEPDSISSAMSMTQVSCFGDTNGTASVVASGGTGLLTYLWSPSMDTTSVITNIGAGMHYVTITDANGCTREDSIEVTAPVSLTINVTGTDVNCYLGSDGTATVTTNGGTTPYNYQWSPSGQTTPTATNLLAGYQSVTVTDANGCAAIDSVFLSQPSTGVSTSTAFTPLLCNGDGTGTATVTAIGGSGNYSYQWDANTGNQTTDIAGSLQAGTYLVTVTDINGCAYVDSATVTEPTILTSTISMMPTSCNGYTDGSATVVPIGGVGNYSYSWSTSPTQVGDTASNLFAGIYTVTITDGNNCTAIDTIEVTEPSGMTLTMSMTPVSCHSGNDGTATVSVVGGTNPYSFAWSSTPLTDSVATTLSAGMHYVTVTDANGCFKVDSIEVTEPDTLTVSLMATEVSCFGGNDGTTTVTPLGGVGNYTYAWNTTPTQTTATAVNVPTGTYTVTVTDGNGCTATGSVFVAQPPSGVTTNTSMTPVSCFGGNDGTATVTAIGGAGNYTYFWSNAQTTPIATNLTAGNYSVTVTDQNGCFVIDNIVVDEPADITLITGQTITSCFEGKDGTATVFASGGTPDATNGYSYLWNSSPVQTATTATNLNGGETYTVTVTDANGCTATSSVTVDQPTPVQLATDQVNVSCNGFSDATATVSPGGGTPGYTFLWDANAVNQTTAEATGLAIGTYNVTVTDFNGCTEQTSVTITEPLPLSATNEAEDVICKGEATGSAIVLAAGGTPWYSFQWDSTVNNSTSNDITGLTAGSYTVTMTDANGCQITETVTINEPAEALTATYEAFDVSCFGDRDGQIEVYATGGIIPYQYSLDNQSYSNASSMVGLTPNEYLVNVRDDAGCVYTDTITITEPEEIIVDAGPDLLIEYGRGEPIVLTVTNGQIPYQYSWTPADSSLSCANCPVPLANPTVDMFYTVTVMDANGCMGTDEVAVRLQKTREVYIATGFSPNGDGINDYLFVQGGEHSMTVVEMMVYDRWGEQVFKAENANLNEPQMGWDGTFRGQPMNAGVYGWTVIIEFSDGERLKYAGNTTLIR